MIRAKGVQKREKCEMGTHRFVQILSNIVKNSVPIMLKTVFNNIFIMF